MIKTLRVGKWSVLFGFLLIDVILYFPVLNKGFVSDDFTVLYRLIYSVDFTPPGFFRPGADISLYITYLLSGLSPTAFNVSNLLLHVLNAWLLYLICRQFFSEQGANSLLPVLISFLFLIYPFHQEPIVWVLGRGILLSTSFALLSLLILFRRGNSNFLFFISSGLYFISLTCYESAFFLPVIVYMILRSRNFSNPKIYRALLYFFIAILIHLTLRFYFSGSVIGAYGKDFNAFEPVQYIYEYSKFWLRLVMVPLPNIYIFLGASILIILTFLYSGYRFMLHNKEYRKLLISLGLILFISFLIPAFFGITIRTTEGDRFLYFPSVFFCIYLGLIFTSLKNIFPYLVGIYSIVSVSLIFRNNAGWKESSDTVRSIINAVKANKPNKIVIYNLPGGDNGKYIFRNGFIEALILNNVDTNGIIINNSFEKGIDGWSQWIQPPVIPDGRGDLKLTGQPPFQLVPPFCLINITTDKVQVYQVGYSTNR